MIICIDPGHGGPFRGAVYHGLSEKDVALSISLLLRDMLNMYHTVYMTRLGDSEVSLDLRDDLLRRVQYAVSVNAALFVSIHCNADPDPDEEGDPEARGSEIWYKPCRWRAHRLASCIGEAFVSIMPDEPYRGLKPGNFMVLNRLTIPAVLVECGFIDNSDTYRSFQDDEVLKTIAYCIYRGIESYINQHS